MSLKYAAEKIPPNHYVLPRIGQMKVEAHAFFSEALYERSEEAMWKQLSVAASYEGVIGAYLMPDAHSGYGVPVGCVVVTDSTILQAGIRLRHLVWRRLHEGAGLSAEGVADWDRRAAWIREVEARVATGLGTKRPALARRVSAVKGDQILRYGAKAIGVRADVCERQYNRSSRGRRSDHHRSGVRKGRSAAGLGRRSSIGIFGEPRFGPPDGSRCGQTFARGRPRSDRSPDARDRTRVCRGQDQRHRR